MVKKELKRERSDDGNGAAEDGIKVVEQRRKRRYQGLPPPGQIVEVVDLCDDE